MEESGYTRSYRRRWNHPAFRNLRDAAIWSWMTDAAAWRDTAVNFDGRVVKLKRGQLVTSERFIAEGFCIGREVVRRLLDRLVSESMIARQSTHGGTVITICKYDVYQASPDSENPPENPRGTHEEPTGNPNKKEGNKGITEEYKFNGKTIRLKSSDYDRWKKSFYAIPDFDAELTRIDSQVEGKGWFAAAAGKLNYNHQQHLARKAEKQPEQKPSADTRWSAIIQNIKRAYAEKKTYLRHSNLSEVKAMFERGEITAEEAAYSGHKVEPGDNSPRETSERAA